MFLRNSEMFAWKIIPWIRLGIITSPGLSWDALLKHSKIKLELWTDPDVLLLFEKGIRGGISMIPNRFGKANNKFMGDTFDPSQP